MSGTETVEVAIGQVWADNDARMAGRTLRVAAVTETHAVCITLTNDDNAQRRIDADGETNLYVVDRRGKMTRIRLDRFRPTSTGYRLMKGSR